MNISNCNDIQPGGGYCLFYQPGASGCGEEVKSLLTQLKVHGCKGWRSIPTTPGENNVSKGMLTYNYVKDQKGYEKLCWSFNSFSVLILNNSIQWRRLVKL